MFEDKRFNIVLAGFVLIVILPIIIWKNRHSREEMHQAEPQNTLNAIDSRPPPPVAALATPTASPPQQQTLNKVLDIPIPHDANQANQLLKQNPSLIPKAEKEVDDAYEAAMNEKLRTLDAARGLLGEAVVCLAKSKEITMKMAAPGLDPVKAEAQMRAVCVSIGRRAADAYPELRDEFNSKVLSQTHP